MPARLRPAVSKPILVSGKCVSLKPHKHHVFNCSWGYALGHTMWPAAPHLIDFLVTTLPKERLATSRVIELGAGLGVVGHVRPLSLT